MRVTVVGAGVIGLCSALELAAAGHAVAVVAADTTPATQSDRAGAIWLPLLHSDPTQASSSFHAELEAMSRRSYARYSELLGRAGVRLIRNHELFRDRQPPPDYLADILPDLEATDDDRLPSGFTYRWSCTTVAIETPLFMRWLMERIAECHVRVRRATVSSLAEFSRRDQDAVVNCSGLGARDLASDPKVQPVKGQLLLHDPIPYDEALGAHEYGVLPRADALVLGSLFQERFDHCEPTEENTDRIWAEISGWERVAGGCVGLPPGALRRSRIRRTIAGLRPYRAPGIRLQVEQLGDLPVIHNYGHGGSGYTLAWGCAESVVGLLKSL